MSQPAVCLVQGALFFASSLILDKMAPSFTTALCLQLYNYGLLFNILYKGKI